MVWLGRGRGSEKWDFPFQQQTAIKPDAIRSLGTHSVSIQPIALFLQQSLASSIPTGQGTANYL